MVNEIKNCACGCTATIKTNNMSRKYFVACDSKEKSCFTGPEMDTNKKAIECWNYVMECVERCELLKKENEKRKRQNMPVVNMFQWEEKNKGL